jgi:hypothetical protein
MGEEKGCESFDGTQGGEFKASLLVGERFGERFSRSREKILVRAGFATYIIGGIQD